MKRDRATQLIEELLGRVIAGGWPLDLVTELRLFGSYARGALEPHDVDIDVEYVPDKWWKDETLPLLLYGRDPTAPLRRAVVGRSRGVALTFDLSAHVGDIDMLVLWRRGESLPPHQEHAVVPCRVEGRGVARGALPHQDPAAAGASYHSGGPGRAARQGPGALKLKGRCIRARRGVIVWRILL